MKNFQYLHPESMEEASGMLGTDPKKALPNGGGTDLLSLMKLEISMPEKVVNLKSIPGMKNIEYTPGAGLRIGALATIAEIAEHPVIAEKYAILSQAAGQVASPQLRNVGTLGGNLCQRPRCIYFRGDFDCIRKGGDLCYAVAGHNKYHCITSGGPCFIVYPSDPAVALLALDAKIILFSRGESRSLPVRDFFVLPEDDFLNENILKPGEFVTGVQVPDLPAGTRSGYHKFMERGSWDFAVVSVGAVIRKDGDRIESGRMAFGGVAPVPWQEDGINRKLSGLSTNPDSIAGLAEGAFEDAQPLDKNTYKLPLVRNLIKRLLTNLLTNL